MLNDSQANVVKKYLEEMFGLLSDRATLNRRLADVERTVRSILGLHSDEDVMPYMEQLDDLTRPEGFMDAVRKVLRSSDEPLTPAEVKEKLSEAGFSLDGYSNALASIHTILKRLALTEVVGQTTKGGKPPMNGRLHKLRDRLISRPENLGD